MRWAALYRRPPILSWCICFTGPCGSRHKLSTDERNIFVDGIGDDVLREALESGHMKEEYMGKLEGKIAARYGRPQ